MKATGHDAEARLRALLNRYGIAGARPVTVARGDVEVIRLRAIEGLSVDGDLALRVYPPGADAAAIESELAWLRAMADEGLHVPRPLADRDGRSVQCWMAGDTQRPAVLMHWLPGRFVHRGLAGVHLRRLGELIARMHTAADALTHAARLPSQRRAALPDLAAWADGRQPAWGRLPRRLKPRLRELAGALQAPLAHIGGEPQHSGFVHGDLHLWNTLHHRGAAGAIDFSECGWGPRALDLAALLQYVKQPLAGFRDHGASYPAFRDALLEGYARRRALADDILFRIDLLIALRAMLTLEWVLEDWPRPDWRPWGPAFIAQCEASFRGLPERL